MSLACASGCEPAAPSIGENAESRQSTPDDDRWGDSGAAARPQESGASDADSPPLTQVSDRAPGSSEGRSDAAWKELRRVIARYRAAKSYRDRGVVRVTYRVADRVEHDSAPLSVHYIAPDTLTMEAYSTRVQWQDGTLRAFVDAPEVNRLDRQLLKRSFKHSEIEVAKLYQDPLFAHFATAGPGGPAPQIELLFGEEPLAGFFADEMRLDLGEEGVIDGRRCRRLLIEADGATYVFWIDRHDALVRRIELPSIELPHSPTGPSDPGGFVKQEPRQEVTLSIDFVDAEINGSSKPLADRLPQSNVVTVDTLTFAPPPLASPLLGRKPQPFRLPYRFPTDEHPFKVTERGSDRQHTILLWVANHSGSELAIEQLAAFADQLPSDVRRASRFVVVQAEKLSGSSRLQTKYQNRLGWTIDEDAIGRDRFGIEEAPAFCVLDASGTVHWFQSPVGPEMTATLDGLLRDLHAGIDVGSTLRQQYESDLDTYRKLLQDRVVE